MCTYVCMNRCRYRRYRYRYKYLYIYRPFSRPLKNLTFQKKNIDGYRIEKCTYLYYTVKTGFLSPKFQTYVFCAISS